MQMTVHRACIIAKPETKTKTALPTRSFYPCQSDKDFRKQNVYWTLFIKTCCVCFGPSGSGTTRIDDLDRCVIYYNQSNITCGLFSVLFLSSNSIRCCWLAIYLYSENIHAKLCTHILLSSSIVTLSFNNWFCLPLISQNQVLSRGSLVPFPCENS